MFQIISDTKANVDTRVCDPEKRALTKAKQAKEYADAHVCDTKQRALLERKHTACIVREERQVTLTRLAAQTRHIKSRERRLFQTHTALHAKEDENLQTLVDAKKSLVSLKSSVGLLQLIYCVLI